MMSESNRDRYLDSIHSPDDLKALPPEALDILAEEIREDLIRFVRQNGGHLASNLGVVELSIALHRVFSTPYDHIIFDVGHQSYVHKMLTGRREAMETLRQAGGLSGFTSRRESEHDCFGAGHSSTSLSAALGFAMSDKLSSSDAFTVAVVGDGAYTGGMVHEALNNCHKDLRLIIVLNENEMSISKNIGRFASTLSRIRAKSGYFKTKKATGVFLRRIPLVGNWLFSVIRSGKIALKNAMYSSNYFENMGLTYLGPIDGNDVHEVEQLLREAKKLNESVIVHVKTQKGKGYAPAEDDPSVYHGMSPDIASAEGKRITFSRKMGEYLTDLAKEDPSICAITAAMGEGTGLSSFQQAHPDRFFDVGIAEAHALTFAAGLAANGISPFVALYSTFLQRGYDNLIHDIALQELPVKICVDRAGLSASDGPTHHGIFDVSFLSQIPRMKIYTPMTYGVLRAALREALASHAPVAIRYANATESEEVRSVFYGDGDEGICGARASFDQEDSLDALIITYGEIVKEALRARDQLAKQGISVGIILLETLKPYNLTAEAVLPLLPCAPIPILFLEEGIKNGGMGMLLREELHLKGVLGDRVSEILAIEDHFAYRSENQTSYEAAGIDRNAIVSAVCRVVHKAKIGV